MAVLSSEPAVPKAVPDSPSSKSGKFTSACKLLRAVGYEHVMQAENIADKQFKIFFVQNSEKNARLGIITSKKAIPRAVNRNLLKRIIREAFRHHNIKRSKVDMVVMVKRNYPDMANARFDNLKKLFNQLENRCADI